VTNFKRFAVYYAPEPGPLADFGAHWLGWDMATGRFVHHPSIDGLDIATLTATPRKYGLHGTIKPPFRLAEGCTISDLETATAALCAQMAPLQLEGLALSRLGGFLALTITGDTAPLNQLANKTVQTLDPFRAALSEAELERRRKARLSPQQEALLAKWGYPYVMEEFRFHITLTGKMPRTEAEAVRNHIEPVITPLLPRPFPVESLCLVGEDENGLFHMIRRYALTGPSAASNATTA